MSLRLASTILLILLPQFLFAQFTGGNSDGVSNAIVLQSSCLAYTTDFMFSGGSSDGFSSSTITQGACLPVTTNFMFSGGSSDGFSSGTIIQGVCLPITTDFMFYGGSSDGFSNGTIIQGVCIPATTDFIFYGGIRDGFGLGIIEQTICANTTPLPIELLEFKAKLGKEGVEISWITATEINNDFFTVEKSNSGFDFYSLTKIAGAGNSTQQLKYSVIDISPFQGINYYRLKQTDYDGKFDYSRVISVAVESSLPTNSIYPNPNEGKSFYVKLPDSGYRNILIKIQGLDGKTILSETVYESGTFEFFLSVKLTSGVYIVSIFDNLNFSNVKLVVK